MSELKWHEDWTLSPLAKARKAEDIPEEERKRILDSMPDYVKERIDKFAHGIAHLQSVNQKLTEEINRRDELARTVGLTSAENFEKRMGHMPMDEVERYFADAMAQIFNAEQLFNAYLEQRDRRDEALNKLKAFLVDTHITVCNGDASYRFETNIDGEVEYHEEPILNLPKPKEATNVCR